MCNDASHLLATVAAVGKNALDEGEEPTRLAQHLVGTIAILDVGGMYHDAQQETERGEQDVSLATLDLLARVVA